MSIEFTDTQLVILSAAAQREDRCLVTPKSLKGGAAQKIAAKLLAAGLVKEIKAKPGMAIWRREDEAGQSFSLKLTAAGLRAIAIDDGGDATTASSAAAPLGISDAQDSQTSAAPAALATAPREGTKMARVVGLLQRDGGASLAEIIAATDWLPHTTRAALTGLRKRGYVVTLDRSDDERGSTYSIPLDRNLADGKEGVPAIEPPTAAVARSKKAARAISPSRKRSPPRGQRRDAGSATSDRRRQGETSTGTIVERGSCARRLHRATRRSRRRSAQVAVAQPFGRDPSRPSAALAASEGSRAARASRDAG
jgi:hypothetical protein